MKTPTHREIANACEVSSSTVSRAINRHPSIPEATRKHILAVAKDMGWEPNPLASAYMSHLRSTRPVSFKAVLGMLVDYPMLRGMEELPSHIRLRYTGFQRRATEYGYAVEPFSLQDPRFASDKALDRTLYNKSIPGFAISGLSLPRAVLQELDFSRYATVTLGYSVSSPSVHRVAMDTAQSFRLMIDRIWTLGYQRIAVAVSTEYDKRTNHGFLMPACLAMFDPAPGKSLEILKLDDPPAKEIESIARWLRRIRPDFAFGPGVYEAILRLGWKIPQDIGFATFDRSPGFPEHAGLDQRHEALGSLAADMLISEVTHNRRGIPEDPVEHLIQGLWVDAASAPARTPDAWPAKRQPKVNGAKLNLTKSQAEQGPWPG